MTLNDIEAKLKDIWANNKLLLVLVAIPLLILKFRSVIIDLLVKDSRQIVDDTAKKDAALATQQTVANAQADQVIQDANKAKKDSDSKPVDENWNK